MKHQIQNILHVLPTLMFTGFLAWTSTPKHFLFYAIQICTLLLLLLFVQKLTKIQKQTIKDIRYIKLLPPTGFC